MAYKQRGNPRITVRLPSDLIERVKKIAKENKTTPSEIIRMATVTAVLAFDSATGSTSAKK